MYRILFRNLRTGKTSFYVGTMREIKNILAYGEVAIEPDPYNPPGFPR